MLFASVNSSLVSVFHVIELNFYSIDISSLLITGVDSIIGQEEEIFIGLANILELFTSEFRIGQQRRHRKASSKKRFD